jgi:amidase
MQDTVNAFVSVFTIAGAADGPLAGLTFGAKDIYDIAGHVTGCGSPDWVRTHNAAETTAPAVQALLDAGATLVGKTHTDEIAYSLMGVNAHYGTPINTKAPDRVPGGSSSGSVAATAAGLIDIGLGSDTGGSVRMPASFCGVYGIRTTHGRIDLAGVMPLAPSFDTAGWFARDAKTLARTGMAYGIDTPAEASARLIIAQDAMVLASTETRVALTPALTALQEIFGAAAYENIADAPLADWREVFRVCQAAEVGRRTVRG